MKLKYRLLLFLTSALILFGIQYTPHQMSVQLGGDSVLTVPADRATISLRVGCEGTKQVKVAEQVRQTTDEILALLRPLSLLPHQTSAEPDRYDNVSSTALPPITTLSVDTFSSHSYPRSSMLGDTTTYSSTTTITAEFRAMPIASSSNDIINPGAAFYHLSAILPSLAKASNTKINHLKWSLSPEHLASLQSESRQKAMSEVLTKISDYTTQMRLYFPSVRCSRFREEERYRPYQHWKTDFDTIAHRDYGAMRTQDFVLYDELNGHEPGIERPKLEVFGLEPQSIEIASHVETNWIVTEWDMIRSLSGLVL